MTFENLDSNFDKVASGDFKKGGGPEVDHLNKTEPKSDEEKYESKFEQNKLGGLLHAFQEKLKKSRNAPNDEGTSDSFDTITITTDDIIKTPAEGPSAEVSEEEISKLLPKTNTEQIISEGETKSPITDGVETSEDIIIVNTESNDAPPPESVGEVFQTVKIVPRRYDDDHPVIDTKAHLSDGFSQQAIHRASQGESPSGMPHNDKEVDGDYIASHLRSHREKKAAARAKAQETGQQQSNISETIITETGGSESPSETILTDLDTTP